MNHTTIKCISLVVILFTLALNWAEAHQQKMALTKIELNPRTNNLEIMHRFEVHDAEHALSELQFKGADIMASEETQDAFAKYVTKRFGIYTVENEPLDLKMVGHELDGKHFWVYQETPRPKSIQGLRVVHNALREIWFAQTNTVNIKIDGEVNTLSFTENTEVLSIDFQR